MSESTPAPAPPTRVVLVRHGESNTTVRRVVGGPRTCSGLSSLGRRQAEALRDRLEATGELAADALYASGYPRAIETAGVIAPVFGRELVVEEGFGEHDPGPECDGLTFEEFVDRHGFPDWEGDPFGESFPGGETIAAFHHRVGSALSRTIARHPGGSIVVVCHGGVIDAALRFALRAPTSGGFDVQAKNTSITELLLVRPGRWRLERYNDSAHLAGLPLETPRSEAG